MELDVGLGEPGHVVPVAGLPHRRQAAAQLVEVLRGTPAGRHPGDADLDQPPRLGQLDRQLPGTLGAARPRHQQHGVQRVPARRRVDEGTPALLDAYHALVPQLLDRLAHGQPADLEQLGEPVLGWQPRVRRVIATQDRGHKMLDQLVGQATADGRGISIHRTSWRLARYPVP
jgi:hypothetical protein